MNWLDWIVIGLMLWTDIMLTFVLVMRIREDKRRNKRDIKK